MSKIIKIPLLILLLVLGGAYMVYEFSFSKCGVWDTKCQEKSEVSPIEETYDVSIKDTKVKVSPSPLEGTYEFSIKDNGGNDTYIAILNIENSTTKSFVFTLDVATQGGIGAIKGPAEIIDTNNAKASLIENGRTCDLAFQISDKSEPQTIIVKENSPGCLQFHGASVQFEHTYVKKYK